ncbi:MAG: PhnD/SsuA/transferrin family substrate-binding protein [Rhodocyclaceae bacterium]|nr:PhnD/SsuA/transferrin family substrate-binding protein [Rhodocyclaceae bacterium]
MRCVGLLIGIVWAIGLARAEEWRFAPLPLEAPETVVASWKPTLDYLAEKLGVAIRIDYSDSYEAIIDKFASGQIELAYLGPLPYVELKKRLPAAEPLVHFREKDGAATYTCALVAVEGNMTLRQMQGKKVALTQPLSTCGYLAAEGLLRAAGTSLEKNRYRYLDKHDAVALAVVRGEYDLGSLRTAIAKKYRHLGLTILAESPPFPALALVAHGGRIDPARRERLRKLLLEVDPAIRARWGEPTRHGAAPAQDADYDVVRGYLQNRTIPRQGNF